MALEKLAMSLSWLQRFWGVPDGAGHVVREAYERLQIETGLEGNIFLRSYKRFGILASHIWYKIFWEYLDHFNITLELDETMVVPHARERDRVFMEEVVRTLDRSEWVAINRMRKKMKIYFFSQLSHCDGLTVRDSVVSGISPIPSLIEFPHEEPTIQDRRLWQKALRVVTSPNYRFQIPLGYTLRIPYDLHVWYITSDRERLLQVDQESRKSTLYIPSQNGWRTRSGTAYSCTGHSSDLTADYTQFASVTTATDNTVILHSTIDTPITATTEGPRTLLAAIRALIPTRACGMAWTSTAMATGSWMLYVVAHWS